VNEITATNAATGGAPQFGVTGGDTNIWGRLQGKGTGLFLPQVKLLTDTWSNTSGAEKVASTLTVPSIPFATTVLILGTAYADLGTAPPTVDWQHRIRRGSTTAGTQLSFSNHTKSAATGIDEQRTTALIVNDTIAANTSTSYVWTTVSSVSSSGIFQALVFAS
jgi:hypothetical protein